jgi:hypothetical protein
MSTASHYVSELRERGWTRVEGALEPSLRATFLSRIRALHETRAEAPPGLRVPYLNQGHDMVYNVQNKDLPILKTFLSHPILRECLVALLNDEWYRTLPTGSPNYILRSLLGRSGGPTALPLHIDSFIPASGSFSWSVQGAFVLEEQSVANGCTVAVPGSHRFDRYADQDSLAKAEPIASKPGDLVLWDSRLWHGTTANKSGGSRWSLIATFARWWLKQNYDLPRTLPQAFYENLTNEEKAIMGYCSIPPRDELEGIDIKGGYECLRPRVEDYRLR